MYSTGMTFKLKPGCYPEYKKAHDELWPDMVEVLRANEMNMVIYHYNDRLFLLPRRRRRSTWSAAIRGR